MPGRPKPRRVLGYARVSSAEQAIGTSLQDQQAVMHGYAKKVGVRAHRMFVEAESAVHEKLERREQMQMLLREVQAGDLVLVDKIDRWSRDPEFAYRSIREILEKGAHFYAVGEDIDPSTSQGDSALGLRILFAREEHKRIKQRMVGTRNLLVDRGYYAVGQCPIGYRRQNKRGLERNILIVEEGEAEIVRDIYARYLRGQSMKTIAREIGRKFDLVKNTLHNRVYLGEQRDSQGHWIQGRHPAIIDARTFAEVHAAIDDRRHGRWHTTTTGQTATWILRDVARCSRCRGKMCAAYGRRQAPGSGDKYQYYYWCPKRNPCARPSPFVPMRALEAVAEPLILARLEELRDRIAHPKEAAPRPKAINVEGERARIAAKRERILAQFEDGDIDREEKRAKLAKLDAERTALAAKVQPPPVVSSAQWRAALQQVDEMRRAWGKITPQERRQVVNALARAAYFTREAEKTPEYPIEIEWFTEDEILRRESGK